MVNVTDFVTSMMQVSFLIGFITIVVAWIYSEYLAFKKKSISSKV